MRRWHLRGEDMGPAPNGGTGIPSQLTSSSVTYCCTKPKPGSGLTAQAHGSKSSARSLDTLGAPWCPQTALLTGGLSDLSLGNDFCNWANSYRQNWPRRKKWGSFCSPCQSLEGRPQKRQPPFPWKVFLFPPSFIPHPVPEAGC